MSFKPKNIDGAATTIVSSTPCMLHTIVINTTSGAAITVYDNATEASGEIIAVFPAAAVCGTYLYDVDLNHGLVVKTEGAGNITVSKGPQGN